MPSPPLDLLALLRPLSLTLPSSIRAPSRHPPRSDFTNRDDIAILLIQQGFANQIRHVVDSYKKPLPAILEIPSKDTPYDPSKDSILSRGEEERERPGAEHMLM